MGFRSLQASIDTTTPGGRLVFHVFTALAEFERDLISERTRAGLAAARARGRKGGRRSVMTPSKLAVTREMYASRAHTTAAIAATIGVSRATLYRALGTEARPRPEPETPHVANAPPPTGAEPTPPEIAVIVGQAPDPRAAQLETAPPSPRRSRAVAKAELPSREAALGRECPLCGAQPGVMCRDTRSRAKRKPDATAVHPLLARPPLAPGTAAGRGRAPCSDGSAARGSTRRAADRAIRGRRPSAASRAG